VLPFVAAQIVGGALAVVVIRALYPRITPAQAADIIVPHQQNQAGPAAARAAHDGAAPSGPTARRPPAD
jgi:glycerol uptake facilitator-like aquaporin